METKFCTKCEKQKPVSEFGKNKSKKDGLQSYCKECVKIYKRKHYEDNTDYYKEKAKTYRKKGREELNEFKSTLKCAICGESRWWVLDFHHENPKEKEYTISSMVSAPLKLKEELEKCIPVCSNCHRDIHFKSR